MVRVTLLCSAAATLAAAFVATPAQAGNCRDPWITQAIREVTGREPNGSGETGECTYTQYRSGQWSNYAELKAAVQAKFPLLALTQQGQFAAKPAQMRAKAGTVPTRTVGNGVQFYSGGKWYWLIGNDGSTLIGNDSGSMIGNDVGGLISNGANILSNANAALRARGY